MGTIIAVVYFVFPIALDMPARFLNLIYHNDLVLLSTPTSLAKSLASNSIFLDSYITYSAISGYIMLFG
ncbi:MAG: hypothetical protein R3321_08450, partial [Nitrososphaeraceae archaeon]|nr:hypothetical protein [Nitrososphaeraceae archaeon]